MIDKLNISYNKSVQRDTLYNRTPARSAEVKRQQRQKQAQQRVNRELGTV
jgi:hypothetical protein